MVRVPSSVQQWAPGERPWMAEEDPTPRSGKAPVRDGYSKGWDYVILAVLLAVLGVLVVTGVIPLTGR
jgi:hypothetical protein